MTQATITFEGLSIPFDVRTLDGFRAWYGSLGDDSRVRASFVGGEVFVEMTPQDYVSHEPVGSAINVVLKQLAQDSGLGRYFFPPSWFTDPSGGLSTEPDGFLVLWGSFTSGRVAINPERRVELVGAPDMVLEVVSTSSKRKDLVTLRDGYLRAGVREYWIADAREGKASLQLLVREGEEWCEVAPADGWSASPLWRRAFRLERFKDRAGLDDFRLAKR